MHIGERHAGMRLSSPEHSAAKNAKAFAYVRPHDIAVRRWQASTRDLDDVGSQTGIAAKLMRAIVVGPIARLELLPLDLASTSSADIIEAQISAEQFHEMALKEGETLELTPRKARIFVE